MSAFAKRKGFSALELIVVTAIGSAVLGMAVIALGRMQSSHNLTTRTRDLNRTLNRLARQLRSDCRQSRRATKTADGRVLQLTGERNIRYRIVAKRLMRIEESGVREAYPIPAEIQLTWGVEEKAKGKSWVVLKIKRSKIEDKYSLAFYPQRILATLAADVELGDVKIKEVRRSK